MEAFASRALAQKLWTDVRTDSPCILHDFVSSVFVCSHNCYHYKIPEQGKGTDDHLLPLGDWLFFNISGVILFPFIRCYPRHGYLVNFGGASAYVSVGV